MDLDKIILEQYVDMQAEHRDLLRRKDAVERRLKKISEKGYVVGDSVTRGKRGRKPLGTVKIQGVPEPEIAHTKALLRQYQHQLAAMDDTLLELLNEAEEYINGIEDSRIRRILRYRYVDGLRWHQVARLMGPPHTEESCRKTAERYLRSECQYQILTDGSDPT